MFAAADSEPLIFITQDGIRKYNNRVTILKVHRKQQKNPNQIFVKFRNANTIVTYIGILQYYIHTRITCWNSLRQDCSESETRSKLLHTVNHQSMWLNDTHILVVRKFWLPLICIYDIFTKYGGSCIDRSSWIHGKIWRIIYTSAMKYLI